MALICDSRLPRSYLQLLIFQLHVRVVVLKDRAAQRPGARRCEVAAAAAALGHGPEVVLELILVRERMTATIVTRLALTISGVTSWDAAEAWRVGGSGLSGLCEQGTGGG